jgi:guanine deaminase
LPRSLLAEAGRIVAVQADPPGEDWHATPRRLAVLPGFVDAHVHSPADRRHRQLRTELLDWLTTHTSRPRRATPRTPRPRRRTLGALLAHGTTRRSPSIVHASSVDASPPPRRGMRVIAGKVLMDVNAPVDRRRCRQRRAR